MSKITYFIKKKIGKDYHNFSIEGENLHDVVMGSRKLSFNDIPVCGLCGGNNLELSAHVTPVENHEYTYIRCRDCKATLNFGQQKKDKELYYLRTTTIEGGPNHGQKTYDWKAYDINKN